MQSNRLHWLDQWRGLAVILMVIYHIAYDVNFLELYSVDMGRLFWFLEGNFVRLTFLFAVGISLYLSSKKHSNFSMFMKRHAVRAGKLFLFALLITAVTFLFDRSNTIWFGILHLISFGILFGALLVKRPYVAGFLGLIGFYLGAAFMTIQFDVPYFLPFGIVQFGFTSFDYFPLFPWISFIFFGISLAHLLDWIGILKPSPKWPRLSGLEWVGQHALTIYLVHQPVFVGILWLFT